MLLRGSLQHATAGCAPPTLNQVSPGATNTAKRGPRASRSHHWAGAASVSNSVRPMYSPFSAAVALVNTGVGGGGSVLVCAPGRCMHWAGHQHLILPATMWQQPLASSAASWPLYDAPYAPFTVVSTACGSSCGATRRTSARRSPNGSAPTPPASRESSRWWRVSCDSRRWWLQSGSTAGREEQVGWNKLGGELSGSSTGPKWS